MDEYLAHFPITGVNGDDKLRDFIAPEHAYVQHGGLIEISAGERISVRDSPRSMSLVIMDALTGAIRLMAVVPHPDQKVGE